MSSEIPNKWRSCTNSLHQQDGEHEDYQYEADTDQSCGAFVCSAKGCKDWMKNHVMNVCKLLIPRSDYDHDDLTVYCGEHDVADDNSPAGTPTSTCFQDVLDDKKVMYIVEIPDIATVPTLYKYIELLETALSSSQRKRFGVTGLLYRRDNQTHMPSSNQKGMFVPIQDQAQYLQFKKNLATITKKTPGTAPHFTLQVTEKENALEPAMHVTKKPANAKRPPVYGSTDRMPLSNVANNQHPPDRESSMLADAFASARNSSANGSALTIQANKKQKLKVENNTDHFSQQMLFLHPFLAKEVEFHDLWLHGTVMTDVYISDLNSTVIHCKIDFLNDSTGTLQS